jgi:ABC-2 type transport system ATP-binding protein
MPQLQFNHVTKIYPTSTQLLSRLKKQDGHNPKGKYALSDISFNIERGETVGYIGVNGSGKSTTVKLLTGILAPTHGSVRVFERDPFQHREKNAKAIGVVFGQRTQLWWDLPLIDSLRLIKMMYDVPRVKFDFWIKHLNDTLDLDEIINKPIRNMSLGQKMRAELIATLIHEPEIAFLDEPTIGLDLLAKEQIRAAITKLNQETGMTLFLTSHDLSDIESLCQRVIILDQGQKVHDGSMQNLTSALGSRRYLIVKTNDIVSIKLPTEIEELPASTGERTFMWDKSNLSAAQVISSLSNKIHIEDFTLRETGLEDIIRSLYQSYQERGGQL